MNDHERILIEQFTQQANTFATMPEHSDREAMDLLQRMLHLTGDEILLDAACGPGLVACTLAPFVRHVTGIDLVPAMIAQAEERARHQALSNTRWQIADSRTLPFHDGEFDRVVSRYAFHHLEFPETTLREMARVTRPGGRVAVVDVTPAPAAQTAYDRWERLRDPSHMRALTSSQLCACGSALFKHPPETTHYRLDTSLDSLLAASFPSETGRTQYRNQLGGDIATDTLGVQAYIRGSELRFRFPITIAVWIR